MSKQPFKGKDHLSEDDALNEYFENIREFIKDHK